MQWLKQLWRKLGLLPRIMLAVCLVMCISLGFVLSFFLHTHIEETQQHIEFELGAVVDVVSPILLEQAVIGDYATINQLLKSQVQRNQMLKKIGWQFDNTVKLSAENTNSSARVPDWFARLIQLANVEKRITIELGGVNYGELAVSANQNYILEKLWHKATQLFLFGAGTTLLVMFTIGLLLRINLRKLDELAKATREFETGNYSVRIAEAGAPELREAAYAFNGMAQQLAKLFEELTESQNEIKEQLHFVSELVATIPLPIFYKDRQGIYLGVNRAWEEFFSIDRRTIVGKTVYQLYEHDPETANIHNEKDNELWRNPGIQIYERHIKTPDGKQHATLYSKATFTNIEGKVAGIIGIITDLTKLKSAEDNAKQALVEKVTAETANQAKSSFIANMSHEIRTPLTAIIGFAESLLDSRSDMQHRIEAIHTIIRSGKHLQQIINDILDISKIEADKIEVEPQPLKLFAVMQDIRLLAELQAEEKGIALKFIPEFPLPEWVLTDETRLKQILMNLTSNAIKFTEHGEVRLKIDYKPVTGQLFIAIEDTGIGVTPEQLKKLFNPFVQADVSTTRRFGGSGLGLYLSRKLAEKLGGDINVASEAGTGSCFTLVIPVGDVPQQVLLTTEPIYVDNQKSIAVEDIHVEGSILVAEDNPENQKLLKYYFSSLGAQITFVENGQQAVEAALARPFDLIFMDIQMPVMDGAEATLLLRGKNYQKPIVALTANTLKTDIERYKEIGCNDFIAKPIEQKKLYEVVQRYLSTTDKQQNHSVIISELLTTNPDMMDIVQMFVDGLDEKIEQLREAITQHDWQEIKMVAHNLKGTGGGVGYPLVTELSAKLMFDASKEDALAVQKCFDELMNVVRRIKSGFIQSTVNVTASG